VSTAKGSRDISSSWKIAGVPLYMQETVEQRAALPVRGKSRRQPAITGNSSIAYVLALAIHEGAEEIGWCMAWT